MILADFHVHSNLSDGRDDLAALARTAAERGFSILGFSEHSPMTDGRGWGMALENTECYRREVRRLKESSPIQILCGLEQDYHSPAPDRDYDYIIGSVHGLECQGQIWGVDESPEILEQLCRRGFSGDAYAMAEGYYALVGDVAEKTRCDIIGHLDLITKFQEQKPLFDENHPRYQAAARAAIDRLLPSGALFEINVGAMTRGLRTTPYPAPALLSYIRAKGGQIIITGDCHDARKLGCCFEEARTLAKGCGFTRSVILTATGREYADL